MGICVYARIKRKCIDENLLERTLAEFLLSESNINKKIEKCVIFERLNSENKVIISFIKEKTPPYNVYDSNIINSEFEYMQLIISDRKSVV